MPQRPFGKLPSGRRLDRIKQSPNYRNGSFSNLSETKMMADGTNYLNLMVNFFSKGVDRSPAVILPSVTTNLLSITDEEPILVWFGHSSYFIRINGKNLLIDPVLSERASPFQFVGAKAFETTRPYTVTDFPTIDALILTHDHYDHLDYNSIVKFLPKVKACYTALGVGSHLAYWGADESRIHEFDWWEGKTILPGIDLIATPARHFSGRGLTRNKTLWTSFVLKTKEYSLFLGGDSGYDEAFKTIGKTYGPFDLAILECGQYNAMWPQIHMMPEETVQASADLRAKVLLPVHWGKFTLSLHPWMEPIERALKHARSLNMIVTTPMIGEPLSLSRLLPQASWWV
jgi:L-ascorbate metabolism protein UlaG (beta-lactamase superfamily)